MRLSSGVPAHMETGRPCAEGGPVGRAPGGTRFGGPAVRPVVEGRTRGFASPPYDGFARSAIRFGGSLAAHIEAGNGGGGEGGKRGVRDDFSLTRHWPGWLIEDTGHIGIGGALSAYSVYWRPHKWDQFPAVDVFGDRTRWAIWRDHTPNPYRLGVSMPSRQGVKPADDVSWNADFSGGRQQVLHDVRTGPRAWPARAAWHVACVQQKKLGLQ